MLNDLLDAVVDFGVDSFDESLVPFTSPSETMTVNANETVYDTETVTIGGNKVTVATRFRLDSPVLSSIQHRTTNATSVRDGQMTTYTDRQDFTGTIVSGLVLELEVAPDHWLGIDELALRIIRKANAALQASDTQILSLLRGYGWDRSGRRPVYVQHLGIDPAKYAAAAEQFRDMGAVDAINRLRANGNLSKAQSFLRMPNNNGPHVAAMELNKANREFSSNGTGFIGFAEAALNTLGLILKFHRERSTLEARLRADANDGEASVRLEEIRRIFTQAVTLRAFRNWGGTNEGQSQADVLAGRTGYYPQQVPCGRFTVIDQGGNPLAWDFWTTRGVQVDENTIVPAVGALNTVDVEAADPNDVY